MQPRSPMRYNLTPFHTSHTSNIINHQFIMKPYFPSQCNYGKYVKVESDYKLQTSCSEHHLTAKLTKYRSEMGRAREI
jgi:hypothetical protein